MWSPRVVTIMYALVAVIFIPLGIVVLVQSSRLMSTPRLRYDMAERCDVGEMSNSTTFRTCLIAVDIPKNTTGSVFLYYGLVNFYQNARNYVKSRSDKQLRGRSGFTDVSNLEQCEPLIENANGDALVPCGLIAQSRFNDTFELCSNRECTSLVPISGEGISWDIDRKKRFLASDERTPEQNALITSEDFMVWMRLAPYRNWQKLYRRVNANLEARTYYIRIVASYPVKSFSGEKFVYLAETTWFGGPNHFLGIAYIVVGCIALILAITLGVRSKFAPEPPIPPETEVVEPAVSGALAKRRQ